jgi:hypothetical protein
LGFPLSSAMQGSQGGNILYDIMTGLRQSQYVMILLTRSQPLLAPLAYT